MDLPEITEVKRITPQPGDRLVVRLNSWPSEQEAQECSDRVRGILGWDGPLLVVGPEVDVEVIGPAEPSKVSLDFGGNGLDVDDEFFRWLRNEVRRRGGDPTVLGP